MEGLLPPSIGFDKLLAQLHEQHQALRRENQKLRQELMQLKADDRLGRKKAPPPVPPMPPKLLVADSGLVPAVVNRANLAPSPGLREAALDVDCFEKQRSWELEPEKPMVTFCVPGAVETEQPPVPMMSGNGNLSRQGTLRPRRAILGIGGRETIVETLSGADIMAMRKRLERMFGAKANQQKLVTASSLLAALEQKSEDHAFDSDMCLEVMAAMRKLLDEEAEISSGAPTAKLNRVGSAFFGGSLVDTICIPFDAFADLILSPDLCDRIGNDVRFTMVRTINTLCATTVDELIEEATRGDFDGSALADKEVQQPKALQLTNLIVSIVVIVNMVALGISVDRDPDHWGWLLLETACCIVWVGEMVVKLTVLGCYGYFRGESGWWNISDLVITIVSIGELFISIGVVMADAFGYGSKVATSSRVVVMLRILRVARVIRLLKLLNTPILQDFANAVSGFVIGMPSLVWVMVFFLITLCVVGLTFRITLGPAPGQDLTSQCGSADDQPWGTEDCPVHWLYGEEFFGTVRASMFTSFRFMLGDYDSRGGKSIVVALSKGYGPRFEVIFVIWMIGVIFGLFNIVTAIFVETTVAGLKYNDVKKKYHRQYERRYVQTKLKDFVERFSFLVQKFRHTEQLNEVQFDEEEFVEIVKDETIVSLLDDLDIEAFNPAGMFYTFDGNRNGFLTLEELAQGIMKARGKLQKTDILAAWMSTRALHGKFDELKAELEDQKSGKAGITSSGLASMQAFSRQTSPSSPGSTRRMA